ncbi:MAG: radical SAM protein [Planctomycetota bacterium]|jgi:wyosine [tRNA(Phe)-imidazoG37] synthetase (radical SAM superfamily)
MAGGKNYLYGPVPSRRLGLSLGIDIVPFKACSLDCIYCQLGRTIEKTIERRDYGPIEPILAELKETLAKGLVVDFITIAGSGEPTLNSRLGELIDGIKEITNTAIAILTNGTLLYRQDVRAECAKADVVMPSLDAGDEQTFQRINCPHDDISIEKLISGLCVFRNEFAGQIWLELFFVEAMNTDAQQITKIKNAIERINPDKVQLNTAVRPTADPNIKRLNAEKLQAIAARLGPKCEVVADFSSGRNDKLPESEAEDTLGLHFATNRKTQSLLSMLKRRPCSLTDICSGLGINRNEALKYISDLQRRRLIHSEKKDERVFFKTSS